MTSKEKEFSTLSGLPLKAAYGPGDVSPDSKNTGQPGRYPFMRGVHPTMYRGRPWTMRQYAGFGTAEETNKRFKYLLEAGQTGLSVAFDLPTQMGLDSDAPLAKGEVGKVGVAIDTLEDMEGLLKDIPLDRVSTSMTINATAPILLALYLAVADKQGVAWDLVRGTVQNDILKEYIARGTYIYPVRPSLRLITDLFRFCQEKVPKWNVISVSGYHMREAGCTAVQEVAFTLANGLTYLEAARVAGLDPNKIGEQISFFFGVHNDFIEEIAKFRAARRLWARLVTERFGITNDRARMMRFHSQTAGCSLTAQQPKNNVVRVAIQALASVLGGTQSLHTNSLDEALALPTEESARTALRTQQIIAYESGVTNTVDPCAGSYAIEALTDEIERRSLEYLAKIDQLGGMIPAIEQGYVQKEIQNSAYQYQKDIEAREQIVVGVNGYEMKGEKPHPILKVGEEGERQKVTRLRKWREGRDTQACEKALQRLDEAARQGAARVESTRDSDNLMPLILEAIKVRATLGEISTTLKAIFGKYREKIVV